MTNVLIRKLENFGALSPEDKQLLGNIVTEPQEAGSREDLVREGEAHENVFLILEGFASRYKVLADGKRQIMAYLIPGDFCDLHVFILKQMDHSIGTLSPCKFVKIPRHRIMELTERPAIARALWWATLVDEATLREWIVNVGARAAEERVAHLFCELLLRLQAVGLSKGNQFELPITQVDLAATVGLSSVHVNRVIRSLRDQELITLKGRHLVILDIARLRQFSGFQANYLHLDQQTIPREGTRLKALSSATKMI